MCQAYLVHVSLPKDQPWTTTHTHTPQRPSPFLVTKGPTTSYIPDRPFFCPHLPWGGPFSIANSFRVWVCLDHYALKLILSHDLGIFPFLVIWFAAKKFSLGGVFFSNLGRLTAVCMRRAVGSLLLVAGRESPGLRSLNAICFRGIVFLWSRSWCEARLRSRFLGVVIIVQSWSYLRPKLWVSF